MAARLSNGGSDLGFRGLVYVQTRIIKAMNCHVPREFSLNVVGRGHQNHLLSYNDPDIARYNPCIIVSYNGTYIYFGFTQIFFSVPVQGLDSRSRWDGLLK